MKIEPRNKMAQLLYRAAGNPSNTLPNAAISNCFPGLDYDFKNFWRRAFEGIVMLEWDNYVIGIEDEAYKDLLHHRLLKVEGRPVIVTVTGPVLPGGDNITLPSNATPDVVTMEWSNVLALVQDRHGHKVKCHFTRDKADTPTNISNDPAGLLEVELTLREVFDGGTLALNPDWVKPGELSQGLCSPWQHDYRECACYYWPASRPDYVNIEPGPDGVSHGDNWMAKQRTGNYILDDRKDTRLVTYEDLFINWEKQLRFQIRGRDAEESA